MAIKLKGMILRWSTWSRKYLGVGRLGQIRNDFSILMAFRFVSIHAYGLMEFGFALAIPVAR